MKRHLFRAACAAVAALVVTASAQAQTSPPSAASNADAVKKAAEEGKALGAAVKPTAATQVINPAGLRWTPEQGGVPTQVPTGLGAFSNPATAGAGGTDALSAARAMGLSGVGMKAQADCANGAKTGDPVKDQACVAVNFMASRCLQPSGQQAQIMGRAGATTGTTAAVDCNGTYGGGQAKITFKDGLSATDPLFSGYSAAVSSDAAKAAVDASCKTTTVPTGPDKTTSYDCTVENLTAEELCSKTLSVSVTTTNNPAEKVIDCPAGTVLSGESCVSTSQTNADTTLVCTAGLLQGDQCVITNATPASPNYSCPAGSTLVADAQCLTEQNTYIDASITYVCPAGSSLSGSSCLATVTIPATPAYACNSDETLQASGCVKVVSNAATTSYSCPAGTTLSGSSCVTATTSPGTPTYSCQAGYVLINTDCIRTTSTTPTVVYNCPAELPKLPGTTNSCGLLFGDQRLEVGDWFQNGGCPSTLDGRSFLGSTLAGCIYATTSATSTCTAPATLVNDACVTTTTVASTISGYTCPAGQTVSGSSCISTSSAPATPSYSCPAGQTLSGTTCITETTRPADVSYTCPEGGTLNGASCTSQSSTPATSTYSCPSGQTLVGTQCESTSGTFTPATLTYACPAGQTLDGTQCLSTSAQPATTSYSCPAGGTLSGTVCITTTTTPARITYSCLDGSAPIDQQCRLRSVTTSWASTCAALEQSAGIALGAP
jgi:hypothetical protein